MYNFQIRIHRLSDTTISLKIELEHLGRVTDAAYSPDSKYLVTCDTNRKVVLYTVPDYTVKMLILYTLQKSRYVWNSYISLKQSYR